jgi:hypothetical protein
VSDGRIQSLKLTYEGTNRALYHGGTRAYLADDALPHANKGMPTEGCGAVAHARELGDILANVTVS